MTVVRKELTKCFVNEDWEGAAEIVQRRPCQTKQWCLRQGFFEGLKDSSVLSIHEAVVANAPASLIQLLLDANPSSIQAAESSFGRLPLHCACRRALAHPDVVHLLLARHPDACLIPDRLGRLPIHYALSNGAGEAVIRRLLARHPAAARGVDGRGWTPLHVAAVMGCPQSIVQIVLEAYPAAIVVQTKKGSYAQHCLNRSCPHRSHLEALLDEAWRAFHQSFADPFALQRQRSHFGSVTQRLDGAVFV